MDEATTQEEELLLGQRSLNAEQLSAELCKLARVRLVSVFECSLSSLPENKQTQEVEVLIATSNLLSDVTLLVRGWKRLKRLYLASNQLVLLPQDFHLLEHLQRLDVSRNRLTAVGRLPAALERLDVHANEISELPELPESLTRLACHSNRPLRSLGPLASLQHLTHLNVSFCPLLVSLPKLPASLESLRADACGLKGELNVLGLRALRRLEAKRNHLTSVQLRDCSELLTLILSDNDLLRAPEGVAALPLVSVDLEANHQLPKEFRRKKKNLCNSLFLSFSVAVEAKTVDAVVSWKEAVELRERLAQKQRELLELQSKIK